MEELIFVILQLFGEIVLQIIGQLMLEGSLTKVVAYFKRVKRRNPVAVWFFYVLLGAGLGLLSLLIFSDHFIKSKALRIVNLIVTPIIAGLFMSLVGYLRRKKGQDSIQLDRFVYGASFALAMALVRWIWA
jgi:hypothetical protein